MKQPAKRVLVLVVGWGFIVLGIAGLFLPVLQGILFLLIGLVILSTEYVWAHHLLRRVGERFPKLQSLIDRAKQRAAGWLGRGSKPAAHTGAADTGAADNDPADTTGPPAS